MANVMQMKGVKNNVHRSGFDLSFRNLYSSKTGEIVPVGVLETLPGDSFDINLSNFARTVPFQVASFARLRHYVDAYFVPLRLLWDKFPAWIMQTKNQYYAKSPTAAADNFSSQPYILSNGISDYMSRLSLGSRSDNWDDGGLYRPDTTRKLLQYLGYGDYNYTDSSRLDPYNGLNLPVNIFPLLAYQKIYQDWFRFSQWEDAAPWTYNLDYVLSENALEVDISSNQFLQGSNFFDMRYCNYDKDLFNGLLPSTQFGDEAIASPIVGQFGGSLRMVAEGAAGHDLANILADIDKGYNLAMNAAQNHVVKATSSLSLDSVHPGFENTAGLSVLLIRQAEALQKWKEITLCGSSDYQEQLYKHWNVRISDLASDRCQYLGGIADNIDISEVVNQNLAESGSDANLAGKGVLAQRGHIKFSTNEYGIIMFVSHVKPIVEWENNSVQHPFMLRHKATDYAIPEFDNIGMQALSSLAFFKVGQTPDDVPALGYAPRYFDYKTNYDRVNGAFLTMPGWSLPHMPPLPTNDPVHLLNYDFFRVKPMVTNDLFLPQASPATESGSSAESDLYYHSLMIDCKAVRNLSYDGMPY